MNWQAIGRVISIFVGAVVLLGLEQGFGQPLYIAIPAAVVVYFALRVLFTVILKPGAVGN